MKIGKKQLAEHKPLSLSSRVNQFSYFKKKRAMIAILAVRIGEAYTTYISY